MSWRRSCGFLWCPMSDNDHKCGGSDSDAKHATVTFARVSCTKTKAKRMIHRPTKMGRSYDHRPTIMDRSHGFNALEVKAWSRHLRTSELQCRIWKNR